MEVDLDRYQGLWFELAKVPFYYEAGCTKSTAFYDYRDDGLDVINTCYNVNTPIRQDIGRATPNRYRPNVLNLEFYKEILFNPSIERDIETPRSHYIVLWTDYDNWSFVGTDGDSYWVLSRQPTYNEDDYYFINDMTIKLGYDPNNLVWY